MDLRLQAPHARLLARHDQIGTRRQIEALPSQMGMRTKPQAAGIKPVARRGACQIVGGHHLATQAVFHDFEWLAGQRAEPFRAAKRADPVAAGTPAILPVGDGVIGKDPRHAEVLPPRLVIGPSGRSKRCGDENKSPEPGKTNKHDIDLRATAAKPPFTSGRLMRAIAAKMWQGAQAPQPHFE